MTRTVVVDASVSVAWFVPDEFSQRSADLLEQVFDAKLRLLVPELWHYEMLNTLRSASRRGRMTERDIRDAVVRLAAIPLVAVTAASLGHAAILSMASATDLGAYDATYVVLADHARAVLVTADREILALQPRFPWIQSLEQFTGLPRDDPWEE